MAGCHEIKALISACEHNECTGSHEKSSRRNFLGPCAHVPHIRLATIISDFVGTCEFHVEMVEVYREEKRGGILISMHDF